MKRLSHLKELELSLNAVQKTLDSFLPDSEPDTRPRQQDDLLSRPVLTILADNEGQQPLSGNISFIFCFGSHFTTHPVMPIHVQESGVASARTLAFNLLYYGLGLRGCRRREPPHMDANQAEMAVKHVGLWGGSPAEITP